MPCSIPSNPDIAGIGVRSALYVQNLLCFIPAVWAVWDGKVSDYELDSTDGYSTTNLFLAFAILISCIVEASTDGLANYHASIVLSVSWMNNTSVFVYFLLYLQHQSQGDNFKGKRPNLRHWVGHIVLQAQNALQFRGLANNRGSNPLKAFKIFVQRITLVLGSLHLTIMAILGIWLWAAPQTFGSSNEDSRCALDIADLSIIGAIVPLKSNGLRNFSLALYSLFLVPGINLVPPMMLFLCIHCWSYYQFPPPLYPSSNPQAPSDREASQHSGPSTTVTPGDRVSPEPDLENLEDVPITERWRRAIPTCLGLGLLMLINVIFIVDIELTLHRNRHHQDPQSGDESEWGFGQILAMVLVFMPLRDLLESIVRRRQELQTKLNEALTNAINAKDCEKIGRWFNAGADPNHRGDHDWTALAVAVSRHEWDLAGRLVRAGVSDIHSVLGDTRQTALELAALSEQWEIVTDLVKAGVDVDKPFQDGRTVVEVVTLSQKWELLHNLIGTGANFNAKGTFLDHETKTALHAVCRNKQNHLITPLLKKGATRTPGTPGLCMYEVAILADNIDGAAILADLGLENPGSFEQVWLTAVQKRKWKLVRPLIKHRAKAMVDIEAELPGMEVLITTGFFPYDVELSAVNIDGKNALEMATLSGEWDIVRELADAGVNVNKPFHMCSPMKDTTELKTAYVDSQDIVAVHSQLVKDASPGTKGGGLGRTCLHWASAEGDEDIVLHLLASGANPSCKDKFGKTPLHCACCSGNLGTAVHLLEGGADSNIQDKLGYTPLHDACHWGHTECVRILLENQADPSLQNREDKTALRVAQDRDAVHGKASEIREIFRTFSLQAQGHVDEMEQHGEEEA